MTGENWGLTKCIFEGSSIVSLEECGRSCCSKRLFEGYEGKIEVLEEREVHVKHDLDMLEQFSHLKVRIELKSELGFNAIWNEEWGMVC